MSKAVAKLTPAPEIAPVAHADPALSILDRFLSDPSVPVERVNQAFDFYARMRADAARRAFDAAMAAARAEISPIAKNRLVSHETKSGGTKSYRHEDLAEIARTVDPILAAHGLSYRFRTTAEVNEPVRVTCIVSHRDGHAEENTLCAGRDDTGNKNSLQAIGSTITYLQRYTLKAAFGLAVANDDDGTAASAPEPVSEEQAASLREWIEETRTNEKAFLAHFGAASIAAFPATKYQTAVDAFKAKAGRK